ncbi:MAG: hypothetical protein M0R77_02915 [Gammaproteobacteria bacterium]|nr:hypothetical protein [Gammaproteobacteria bacterium]
MPGCAETQYIFDSSFELGYITADVYDWLYDLDFNLDRLVDYSNGDITMEELRAEIREANIRDFYYDNNQQVDLQTIVTDHFDENYNHLSLVEQCFYDLQIMFGSNDQPESMKHALARRISDCYFGNRFHPPIKRITNENDLSDRSFHLEIMRNDLTISKWTKRMKDRRHQSIRNLSKVDVGELREFMMMKLQQREERFRAHAQMMANLRFDGDQVVLETGDSDYSLFPDRAGQVKKQYRNKFSKKNKKNARKAISRAVELFGKFFDKKDIEGFIKGYEYIVEGDKFNYRLTKTDRTNLLLNTINPYNVHIPYDLEITDKNNIVLAKACYLFEDTPIIDQIIAFTMMIKSGNENDFIQKANLFSTTGSYKGSELQQVKQSLTPTRFGDDMDILSLAMENHALTALGDTREHQIWTNRINDSLDPVFAEQIGMNIEEWNLLCYPNENFGAMMDHPSLIAPQIRLLTNKSS